MSSEELKPKSSPSASASSNSTNQQPATEDQNSSVEQSITIAPNASDLETSDVKICERPVDLLTAASNLEIPKVDFLLKPTGSKKTGDQSLSIRSSNDHLECQIESKAKLLDNFLDDVSRVIEMSQIKIWTAQIYQKDEGPPSLPDTSYLASQLQSRPPEEQSLEDLANRTGISPEIMDVLSQASEESRIPERDDTEFVYLNEAVPASKKIKKRRRRRKWCCCCCQKKKAEKELHAGDVEVQDSDSWSSSTSWQGCMGMLDSRSADCRTGDPAGDTSVPAPTNSIADSKNWRRKRIPDRPNYSLNLWSLLKNSLGKELSKIPMPVNFSEPLSMLQRLTEDYEYSDILDKASECIDAAQQICYVAAFTISSYATTTVRTAKPFNPILGETYEWDRSADLGWRCIAEQVSHHPPSAALYCEGKGWICWQEFTMTSKFRGNSLEIVPLGIAHLTFQASGNHYTWRKVTTVVHNIILGKLWVEQVGDMEITNHINGDICALSYVPYSVFNKKQKEVVGTVKSSDGTAKWVINGSWDMKVEAAQIINVGTRKQSEKSFAQSNSNVLWTRRFPPAESEKYYNLTDFAVQMNELEQGVAPTDSRMRPDQRLMENGKWDEANLEKLRLEDKQRSAMRKRANSVAGTVTTTNSQRTLAGSEAGYQPAWFRKEPDLVEHTPIYTYKGEYWPCKSQSDWSRCPDIY